MKVSGFLISVLWGFQEVWEEMWGLVEEEEVEDEGEEMVEKVEDEETS